MREVVRKIGDADWSTIVIVLVAYVCVAYVVLIGLVAYLVTEHGLFGPWPAGPFWFTHFILTFPASVFLHPFLKIYRHDDVFARCAFFLAPVINALTLLVIVFGAKRRFAAMKRTSKG